MVVEDVHNGVRVHHTVVLAGVYGDTPGAKKLQNWMGHSARLGCGYCLLQGDNSSGTMRFLGYAKPTGRGVAGSAMEGYCGESHLTDMQQRTRAELVEAGQAVANDIGCWGWSKLVKSLPYVDYNHLWLTPVAHALLFGVIKTFWKLLAPLKSQKDNKKKGDPAPWYRMKPNQLRVMKERAAHITCTNDFNRPYRCIVLHRGNWTMEEYLHFTETFSPYILMPDPDVVSVGWVEWVSGVSLVALAWLRPRPARAQCI